MNDLSVFSRSYKLYTAPVITDVSLPILEIESTEPDRL